MSCKEGQCDVVKAFSINLNVQHVNGMTPFDLVVHICTVIRYLLGWFINV